MSDDAVYKDDKSAPQRLWRLIVSVINPRTYIHAFKVLNYYRYTHAAEFKKVVRGQGLRISPTVSFSNGHNIVLGDHVRIGANASIWAGVSGGKIVVGEHTMIAPNTMLTGANYRFGDGSPVNEQAMDEADIVIGRDVWIGAGVVILPGVAIGDGAIIGAGAVLREDVPANSVVAGPSAQVIGRRFVDSGEVEAARLLEEPSPAILTRLRSTTKLTDAQLDCPIEDCGLDSFELITLRTALEQAENTTIPDQEWGAVQKLSDIARLAAFESASITAAPVELSATTDAALPSLSDTSASATVAMGRADRSFALNMPQMALAGLSESWLLKELGDLHWAMLTHFLGQDSGAIKDETGSRLYATFTRIKFDSKTGLRAFNENDQVEMASKLNRFGASFFFAEHNVASPNGALRARSMSTFAKYGERGNNTSLMKGTPAIPSPDAVPSLSEFPKFGTQYRERRAVEDEGEALFECEYEQQGPHDINGVGLLYFAAYPIIFDICLGRFEGAEFLLTHSTISKDVCYFANAEPTETLVFRIHQRAEADGEVHHTATLSRKSDDKRMATIVGAKRFVGLHVPQ